MWTVVNVVNVAEVFPPTLPLPYYGIELRLTFGEGGGEQWLKAFSFFRPSQQRGELFPLYLPLSFFLFIVVHLAIH